jgi:two-component system response regulator
MSKTFLLVEDELNDAVLISRAINEAAPLVRVHIEKNGVNAALYIKGEAKFADRSKFPIPDLILLDLNMPLFDGFEFLEWLRSEPSPVCRIPVVVITGRDGQEGLTRAYNLGANAVITKPTNWTEYKQRIETLARYWSAQNVSPDVESNKPQSVRQNSAPAATTES